MTMPTSAKIRQGPRADERRQQRGRRLARRRPLYLSAQEARALAVLSGTSPFALDAAGGARRTRTDDGSDVDEQALFARLGRFLRAF